MRDVPAMKSSQVRTCGILALLVSNEVRCRRESRMLRSGEIDVVLLSP